jgi:hypothetical protein
MKEPVSERRLPRRSEWPTRPAKRIKPRLAELDAHPLLRLIGTIVLYQRLDAHVQHGVASDMGSDATPCCRPNHRAGQTGMAFDTVSHAMPVYPARVARNRRIAGRGPLWGKPT